MKRPRSPSLLRPTGPLSAGRRQQPDAPDAPDAPVASPPAPKRGSTLADLWRLSPVRESVAVLPAPRSSSPPPGIPVVDLFCGAGGYSCGAALAGHHVVLAVDCDTASLKIHAANHPHATHARMTLGPSTEARLIELVRRLVPPRGPWLLHGSPPCVKFSGMRNATKGKAHEEGMQLVKWYVQLVKKLEPPYWTFEQVVAPSIKDYLASQRVTYHAFNFARYGVPQTRTRCLAGTTMLIHTLRDDKALRVATPVTPAMLLTPPAGATRMRASGGKCIEKFYRPLDKPAWCLLTACKPVYVTEDGRCVRVLTSQELLKLQTFPSSYRMPPHLCSEGERVKLVGNAVPPLMSRLLLGPLDSHGLPGDGS